MSDEPDDHKLALEQAIERYAAAEGTPMVLGWALVVAAKSVDQFESGTTKYLTATDDSSAFHSILGLANYLVNAVTSAQGEDDD